MGNVDNKTPSNLRDLVGSISILVSTSSKYQRFKRMYENDRIAFVHDILPDFANTMAPYQEEILGHYDSGKNRVSVRGPHGLGKTFIAATLTHHTVLTAEDDCKVPTTASAWRQLEKYLWPEIKKIAKYINWTEVGREPYDPRTELLQDSIRLSGGTVIAFAVASDDHETIEGAHGETLFYIFDEAKAIPRPTWNAAEGAFSTNGLEALMPGGDLPRAKVDDGFMELSSEDEVFGVVEHISDADLVDISEQGNLARVPRKYDGIRRPNLGDTIIEGVYRDGPIGDGLYKVDSIDSNIQGIGNGDSIQEELWSNSVSDTVSRSTPIAPMPTMPTQPSTPTTSKLFYRKPTHAITSMEFQEDYKRYNKALALAISTPGLPSGQFYDIQSKKPGYEDWTVIHVTLEEAIHAGRISREWAEQRRRQWGDTSSLYLNRVLGEFADTSEDGMIPLSHIRLAVARWGVWMKSGHTLPSDCKTVIGVDTARSGEDKTVLAERHALILSGLRVFSRIPVTATAGRVQAMATGGKYIHIEMDGIGAGVYDILHEKKVPNLRPIQVNAPTLFRDHSKELTFANVRAAMWWHMRDLLDPSNGYDVMLPPSEELMLDLSTPLYEQLSGGVIKLESKENIVKRLGRSPDYGTACCLAFWEAGSGGGIVI